MDICLDDASQVNFPGDVVYGILCVRTLALHDAEKPVIKAFGCTLIWKSGIKEEIDECSTFFEDVANLSRPEEIDNLYEPLNNKYKDYSKIFTFHLVLPNNLPPSHEVPFGYTRYKLEAYYNNQQVSTFFSVNQWVGLEKRNDNCVKRSSFPISIFSFCHRIQIVLNLNQTHYLPGETVYIGAIIKNDSWRDVLFTQICIIQTTKFWKTHSIFPIKHSRIIKEAKRGYIHIGEEQVWNKHPMHIPAVIPTTCTSNNPFNYFKVEYKIKVLITMINFKTIQMKQKLFIGNWDKSTYMDRKQYIEKLKSDDPPYVITTKKAALEKNIGFIPNYMIYETNLVYNLVN